MIGCGGGTLATMLHARGVRVVIADIEERAFEIARQYFHMPEAIECHVADGVAFLKRAKDRYDAVVLDAYGDEGIPGHFLMPKFFDLVKSKSAQRNALFMMNIMVKSDDDRTPDRIGQTMRKTWRGVRLLDAEGWIDRNAVLVAGAVSNLRRPHLLMPPSSHARKLRKELREMAFRPLRG